MNRTLVGLLLLMLTVASLTCAVLLAALVSSNRPPQMANVFEGFKDVFRPLNVDPPCGPVWMPPEEPMALPAPIRCRFSLLSFRCTPRPVCHTGLHLFPIPHARCSMKTEVYT